MRRDPVTGIDARVIDYDVGGRMNSIGSEHAGDGVSAKRLFVLHTAPNHPLSAPDPHITLKLRMSELRSTSEPDVHDGAIDPTAESSVHP